MDHSYSAAFDNVELRPLRKDDIEFLRNWRNDPINTRFLSKLPFITPEMQKKWFESYLSNDDEIIFAIVENQKLNRIVGSFSLYNFGENDVEFGKFLIGDAEAHGRNIGYNTLTAMNNIVFDHMNMETIKLHVFKDNLPAVKIYTKAGFKTVSEYTAENGLVEYEMILFAPDL